MWTCGTTPLIFSDHADSCWISEELQTSFGWFVPVRASSTYRCLVLDFFRRWSARPNEIEVHGGYNPFLLRNSYSAIHTPKALESSRKSEQHTRKEITAITGNGSGDTFAKSNTSKQCFEAGRYCILASFSKDKRQHMHQSFYNKVQN